MGQSCRLSAVIARNTANSREGGLEVGVQPESGLDSTVNLTIAQSLICSCGCGLRVCRIGSKD